VNDTNKSISIMFYYYMLVIRNNTVL
jgi:hypothetical protein